MDKFTIDDTASDQAQGAAVRKAMLDALAEVGAVIDEAARHGISVTFSVTTTPPAATKVDFVKLTKATEL